MPPLVLTQQVLLPEMLCKLHYVFPSCSMPNHGGIAAWDSTVAELFVLHPIVNLCLEGRLEVVTNDIPIC